jgi:hypothetical protein
MMQEMEHKLVEVSMTQEEYRDAKEVADILGMDVSQFVRTVVSREMLNRKLRCRLFELNRA